MPSFLSKVFGGKKEESGKTEQKKEKRLSTTNSLLEGKFEAVSPTVSPSAEAKEKDGFSLGLLKTISSRQITSEKDKVPDVVPHLSLNLPVTTSRNLGTLDEVFNALTEQQIRDRRLTLDECLSLVTVCATVIALHGLDTPGIMHPHWHSASPESQRRLISSFLTSKDDWQPEFRAAANMYDLASIFRWGLRHLDQPSFGSSPNWYSSFVTSEREKSYPPTAYGTLLPSLVPEKNRQLLKVTLDLFSSLAAHAEKNATSASKLSKLLGLWILQSNPTESGWDAFYQQWERSGRMLEHLFLASLRDEAARSSYPMPRRLLELVKGYPFAKEDTKDDDLLPTPAFATRRYPALFVQVLTQVSAHSDGAETPLHSKGKKGKDKKIKDKSTSSKVQIPTEYDPIRILQEAFGAATENSTSQLWDTIRTAYSSPGEFGNVFSDETVRLLSLASPSKPIEKTEQPSFSFYTPSEEGTHRRSFSLDGRPTNGHVAQATSSSTSSGPQDQDSNPIGIDWAHFSTSGFLDSIPTSTSANLASTLMDKDVEVTAPSRKAPKSSKVKSGRKSLDALPPITTALASTVEEKKEEERKSLLKEIKKIELDESFIDFFSDTLLDRGVARAKGLPSSLVLAKLRSDLLANEGAEPTVEWVIVEQTFGALSKSNLVEDTPLEAAEVPLPTSPGKEKSSPVKERPSSPKPSVRSETNQSLLASTRKRFTFFGSTSKKEKEKEKEPKETSKKRVGEMGEILKEEEETAAEKKEEVAKDKDTSIAAPGTAAVVAGALGAAGVAAVTAEEAKKPAEGEHPTEPVAPVDDSHQPDLSAVKQEASAEKSEPAVIDESTTAPITFAADLPTDEKLEAKVPEPTEEPRPEPVQASIPVDEKPDAPEDELVEPVVVSTEETEPAALDEKAPEAVETEPDVQEVPPTEVRVAEPEVIDGVPVSPEPEVHVSEAIVEEPTQEPEVKEKQPEAPVQQELEIVEPETVAEAEAPTAVGKPEPVEPEVPVDVEETSTSEVAAEDESQVEAAPEVQAHVVEQKPEPDAPVAETEEVPVAAPEPEVEAEPSVETAAEIPDADVAQESEAVREPEPEVAPEVPAPVIEQLRDPSPGRYEEEAVTQDPIPTVEAEPVLAPEGAVAIPEPEHEIAPTEVAPIAEEATLEESASSAKEEEDLPPAPENVVLSGSTPGPHVALSTSEPATTALAEAEDAPKEE